MPSLRRYGGKPHLAVFRVLDEASVLRKHAADFVLHFGHSLLLHGRGGACANATGLEMASMMVASVAANIALTRTGIFQAIHDTFPQFGFDGVQTWATLKSSVFCHANLKSIIIWTMYQAGHGSNPVLIMTMGPMT